MQLDNIFFFHRQGCCEKKRSHNAIFVPVDLGPDWPVSAGGSLVCLCTCEYLTLRRMNLVSTIFAVVDRLTTVLRPYSVVTRGCAGISQKTKVIKLLATPANFIDAAVVAMTYLLVQRPSPLFNTAPWMAESQALYSVGYGRILTVSPIRVTKRDQFLTSKSTYVYVRLKVIHVNSLSG